jgi:hypothetical protein
LIAETINVISCLASTLSGEISTKKESGVFHILLASTKKRKHENK